MSHKLEMKTTMTDIDGIVAALTRMGIDRNAIEVHRNKTATCQGYNTTSQANVIVRKDYLQKNFHQLGLGVGTFSTAYGDIGFVENDGQYKAIVDDKVVSTAWMQKASTYYNIEKTKIELDAKKISYQETTEKGLPVILAKIPNRSMNRVVNKNTVSFNS